MQLAEFQCDAEFSGMNQKQIAAVMKGEPSTFLDWLANEADKEAVIDAVYLAVEYQNGRLLNETNQATGFRLMITDLELAYDRYIEGAA